MSEVRLVGVRKIYGSAVAVDDVSLDIAQGEFVTLLGASGSGKTTCLRMVAGFIYPTSGQVMIGGRDVTKLPPYKRDTAMVFQNYALFPHMTVLENVEFGLNVRKLPKADCRNRAMDALKLVHLGDLGGRYPNQLSGGQRQRVALARAVVLQPKILLLDEPLGALDLKLREELQLEIKRVQSALGITTLFVTHDQSEALSMSDRIAVMKDGRIVQIDTPTKLYSEPAAEYVARFVGRITMIPVKVLSTEDGIISTVDLRGNTLRSAFSASRVAPGDDVLLAVRPECYRIGGSDVNKIDVVVEQASYQGASWTLTCRDADGAEHIVDLPWGAQTPKRQERITLTWDTQACRIYPKN